jgi:tetratricopeptide (TPR) repeat protein
LLLDQASDAAQRAIDLAAGSRPEWLRDLAALQSERARLLFAEERTDAAIDALWQSLALRERVAALSSTPQWQTELEEAYTATRVLLYTRKRPDAALEVAEQQLFSTALAPCQRAAEADCLAEQVGRVANALTQLGWTALLASNPQRALWATQRALTLDPATQGARLNNAHALMLTGRPADALQVYLEGPHPPGGDAKVQAWRTEVLADFQTLNTHGVRDTLMTEVERRFKP